MWFTYIAAIAILSGSGGLQRDEPPTEEVLTPVLHPDQDDGWAPRPLRTTQPKKKPQPKAEAKRVATIETRVELPGKDDEPVDADPPLLPPLGAPKRMKPVREADPIPSEAEPPAKPPKRTSALKARKAPTAAKVVDDDAPLLERTIRPATNVEETIVVEDDPKTPLPKLAVGDEPAPKRWPPSKQSTTQVPEPEPAPPPALLDQPKIQKPADAGTKAPVQTVKPLTPPVQQTAPPSAATSPVNPPVVQQPAMPSAQTPVQGPAPTTTALPEPTQPVIENMQQIPMDSSPIPIARPQSDPRLLVNNTIEPNMMQQGPIAAPAYGNAVPGPMQQGPACPPNGGLGIGPPAEELTNWVAGTRSYLLWKRQVQGRPIAVSSQTGSLLGTSDDVNLGNSFAQEFFVERRLDTAFGWEVVGLLSDEDRHGTSFQAPGGVNFPTGGVAPGFFQNLGRIDASASSKLWSVGTGIVEHFFAASSGPVRAQLSVGPRFLGLYEEFHAQGSTGGGNARFNAITENTLFGADVGAAASWENVIPYLTLSAGAKYGVFGNVYRVAQDANSAGPGVSLGNITKSSRFANLIDVNAEADYRVARGFHLLAGYRLMVLSGLARAAEQPNFDSTSLPNAYTGGNMVVHGLFFGARLHWGGVTDPNVRYGQSRPYTVTVE